MSDKSGAGPERAKRVEGKRYELEVRDERGVWRILLDQQDVVRLGRSRANDAVIKASGVSRNHALLLRAPAGWKIVDLKSSNATLVHDAPVREEFLKPGDHIRMGLAHLFFLEAGAPGPLTKKKGMEGAELGFAKLSALFRMKSKAPPPNGSQPKNG